MKKSHIVNSFSAAMAFQGAVSSVVRAETKDISVTEENEARVISFSDVARADDVLSSATQISLADESRQFTVHIKSSDEWTKKLEQRLEELVTKEALGLASRVEVSELDDLQFTKLRRSNKLDPDVILDQYKRAKMDRELLEVLQKYVRIEEKIPHKAVF